MIKKVTTLIANNKTTIGHRLLVLGGTLAGALITEVLVASKTKPIPSEVVIEEEFIEEVEVPEEGSEK